MLVRPRRHVQRGVHNTLLPRLAPFAVHNLVDDRLDAAKFVSAQLLEVLAESREVTRHLAHQGGGDPLSVNLLHATSCSHSTNPVGSTTRANPLPNFALYCVTTLP